MEKPKVLFVCIHNSARSQIAEAFLNKLAGDRVKAESAGLEPGSLNPLVVKVMLEIGIDISGNRTKGVRDMLEAGRRFSHVITVCDEGAAQMCPVFPGASKSIHWSFADPSSFTGTEDEKLEQTRKVRDAIKAKVQEWVNTVEWAKG